MRSTSKSARVSSLLAVLLSFFLLGCVPLAPATETVTQPSAPLVAAALPARGTPELRERACDLYIPAGEVEGETILCGFVRVPWDRGRPDGTSTDLAYVILRATGGSPRSDAIVHVAGGPGAGSTLRQPVLEFIKRYAPLRVDRDVILYDQRGMGHSVPFFSCPYPDENVAAEVRSRLAAELGADPSDVDVNTAFCQEALAAQGYSPSDLSTATSAADLVDVMAALGYDAYHLYGISYGTRLLMSLLHHFPDQANVRSVVLDSPYPLPEDLVNDFVPLGHLAQQSLFEEVFALCAADLSCAAAYPDLRGQFDDLAQTLASQPLALADGSEFGVEDLYRTLFPFNPTVHLVAYQPRLIAELAQGNTSTLMQLRSGEIAADTGVTALGEEHPRSAELVDAFLACEMDGADEAKNAEQMAALIALWDAEPTAIQQYLARYCLSGSETAASDLVTQLPRGVFNSVIIRFAPDTIQGVNAALNSKLKCTEQWPFAPDPAELAAALREAGQPVFLVEQVLAEMAAQADGCAGWAAGLTAPTPSIYGKAPVLILNGQLDANTPPVNGALAAEQLPQAQFILVPNAGHSILGNHGACPTAWVEQFLANPDQPVDAGCTTGMQIQFSTEP